MTHNNQYLIVLRHGQTLPNLLLAEAINSYFYALSGSDTTIGLTELGFVQAREAAMFIAEFLGKNRLAKIYCSQFKRTSQTADVVQAQLPNRPVVIEDVRIAKRNYGEFWNITYAGVEALFPEEYLKFAQLGGYLYRPPGGENYPDLENRLQSFMRDEIDSTDDNVCVSGHSVGALMLEQMLLGELTNYELVERYENIAVLNASVTIYTRRRIRRLFGVRIDPRGWFNNLRGRPNRTWTKVASYTPMSAKTLETAPKVPAKTQA